MRPRGSVARLRPELVGLGEVRLTEKRPMDFSGVWLTCYSLNRDFRRSKAVVGSSSCRFGSEGGCPHIALCGFGVD